MDILMRTFNGGSAKVEIFCTPNNTYYAKKTLTDLQLSRRFRREVKYQSSFEHPNIVPIYEPCLDTTPPSYVMPAAICTLFDYPKPLPPSFIFDVLAGLEAIHEKGYSHRDLKPQNILIFETANGQNIAAISDFGLLDVPNTANTSTLTQTGMWGGTQNYSAPECFADLKNADYRADFYSFGAILFDIFFGRPRVPCAELTAEGPIGAVIQRCTFLKRELRYSSVSEIRSALSTALSSTSEDSLRLPALAALQQVVDENISDISQIIKHVDLLSSDTSFQENFFKHLTPNLIDTIKALSEPHFTKLLENFCVYISSNGFSFSYCDKLADRAKNLHANADEDGQALVTVAILELGVTHNRFYVEELFIELAGQNISNSVALKIKNAAIRLGVNLEERVSQCCSSLKIGPHNVHRLITE
ncbi:protein kinase domain-containing protein [Desulfovibrio desulfuricans]|uniref:protein kinase domain-containing protein n=1 Tax=Desulfovibrio desulfuricans TaxID=876 RepID=UPI001C01BCDE|nr:protein kinase [Desulfovibrio desulfuricans]MBT9747935.1 protein kinase [Desulfovibrio desulfuricans]